RQEFMHEPNMFSRKFHVHHAHAGEVAAWPIEARNKAKLDWISTKGEHHRGGRGGVFRGECRWRVPERSQDAHAAPDQVGGKLRQPLKFIMREPVLDSQIMTLNVPGFAQALAETSNAVCVSFRRPGIYSIDATVLTNVTCTSPRKKAFIAG